MPNLYQGLSYDNGRVIVYVDGCCFNNGCSNAQAGYGVWFGRNHPLNLSEPVDGYPSNNNAEIQAAVAAISQCFRVNKKRIVILTDSEYLINCATQWIYNWENNGWKTYSGNPVKNKFHLKKLFSQINSADVAFEHVPGHQGIEGNVMADKLAKSGAKQY